jgi:intracellular septation protein
MKFLFDLFPILLFFGVFQWAESYKASAQAIAQSTLGGLVGNGTISNDQAPILLATVVAIVATLMQILYLLIRRKKIDGLLWVSAAIITVMGGLTIYFNNESFIKWKPTILYWCSSGLFLFSLVIFKKNLVRSMMGELFIMPDPIWYRLALAWAAFFFILGGLNLAVAFNFSTQAWVNFKLFGGMGLMFAFIFGQGLLLSKYLKEEPESNPAKEEK